MDIGIWILIIGIVLVGLLAGILVMFAAEQDKKHIWVHIKTGNKYRITHYGKMRRPDTGQWLESITYMSEDGHLYTRWKDDFMLSFQTYKEWKDGNQGRTKV